jgi:hypothetical protein
MKPLWADKKLTQTARIVGDLLAVTWMHSPASLRPRGPYRSLPISFTS